MGSKKTNGSALLPNPIYSNANINEELVVQNLRRKPHSSVTVRCFRKQ